MTKARRSLISRSSLASSLAALLLALAAASAAPPSSPASDPLSSLDPSTRRVHEREHDREEGADDSVALGGGGGEAAQLLLGPHHRDLQDFSWSDLLGAVNSWLEDLDLSSDSGLFKLREWFHRTVRKFVETKCQNFTDTVFVRPLKDSTLEEQGLTDAEIEQVKNNIASALEKYAPQIRRVRNGVYELEVPSTVPSTGDFIDLLEAEEVFQYVEPNYSICSESPDDDHADDVGEAVETKIENGEDGLIVIKELQRSGTGFGAGAGVGGEPEKRTRTLRRGNDDGLQQRHRRLPEVCPAGDFLFWQHEALQSCLAWGEYETGADSTVTVAVIDSGVGSHYDLDPNLVLPGYDAVARTWSSSLSPHGGHGSKVAGVAAAAGENGGGIVGVGWGIKHRHYRVTDSSDPTRVTLGTLLDAIRTAAENGDRVINVSWDIPRVALSIILDACRDARDAGSLVFWSAGNYASSIGHDWSSENFTTSGWGGRDDDAVVLVGATDMDDDLAPFSNYGPAVDVVAPGFDIVTTDEAGGFVVINGTSFAAPMAAGLAALIWTAHPNLTPDQVEDIIKTSAVDLGEPGVDDIYGYGRIDTYNALRMAASLSGATTTTTTTTTSTTSIAEEPTTSTIPAVSLLESRCDDTFAGFMPTYRHPVCQPQVLEGHYIDYSTIKIRVHQNWNQRPDGSCLGRRLANGTTEEVEYRWYMRYALTYDSGTPSETECFDHSAHCGEFRDYVNATCHDHDNGVDVVTEAEFWLAKDIDYDWADFDDSGPSPDKCAQADGMSEGIMSPDAEFCYFRYQIDCRAMSDSC